MNLDLKKVNIANDEDIKEVENEWNFYFDNKHSFLPYKEKLSKLNIIVGFGRGFWAGVHSYSYLTYHVELDKFYWYLRDVESDQDVFFYELEEDAAILKLLKTKVIEKNFDEFDKVLNYDNLHYLSLGKEILKLNLKRVTLKELFGEDTEKLRIALMEYQPASRGSKYPHKEFHKKYFVPALQKELDKQIENYNKGSFEVYRKRNNLYIKINDEHFHLKKI